jgi:biotin carboxyl carrier protein
LKKAYSSGVGGLGDMPAVEANRESLNKLLEARNGALVQAQANLAAAEARQAALPALDEADFGAVMAPIRDSIQAAEARIDEVRAQLEALVIRSPMTGTISQVYSHPGQGVRTGDWIMTIAADEAETITGYVPAMNRFRPTEGMRVGIRLRVPGSRMVTSRVERVGTQWEPIPLELLRDPQLPQLALPVQIGVPPGLPVRPGEVVDIRFYVTTSGSLLQEAALSPRQYASGRRGTLSESTSSDGDKL